MSGYDLYLSYSGRRAYLICPKKYYNQYVKKIPPEYDPRTHMFGSAIGKVFEWFYNNRVWSHPNPERETLNLIVPAINQIFKEEKFSKDTDKGYTAQLLDDMKQYVSAGIKVIRDYKLVTPRSIAEQDLTLNCTNSDFGITIRIGGKADFLHGYDDKIWLIDGKGSKYRDQYTDPEQLIWYALQHYLKYHIAPSRIGFLFWRFPDDPLQWIEYNEQSLKNSLNLTFEVAQNIRSGSFNTKPSKNCNLCDYKKTCTDGQEYLEAMNVDSKDTVDDSVFDIEFV
jgi:hypothetical protein